MHHWAVQVDDSDWYEIDGITGVKDNNKFCRIVKSIGRMAKSTAGQFGGEYVGVTDKTDDQIDQFNRAWERDNPTYTVFAVNCQKYAIEFIR